MWQGDAAMNMDVIGITAIWLLQPAEPGSWTMTSTGKRAFAIDVLSLEDDVDWMDGLRYRYLGYHQQPNQSFPFHSWISQLAVVCVGEKFP